MTAITSSTRSGQSAAVMSHQRHSDGLAAFRTDKVGYPDVWKDYSSVEVKRDDYFGNSRRARVFEIKREQARIDKEKSVQEAVDGIAREGGTPLLVVAEGVQNPGNVGGLLRAAEAAGSPPKSGGSPS